MNVGYVGLGAMGSALARHLIKAGPLIVWDINTKAVDDLGGEGALRASSLVDLARRCDVIVLCLPRSSDVERVIFGDDGLGLGLVPGSLVIDQTSGVPSETARFARQLAARGVEMIDAPVSGGTPAAQAGMITIMASGPPETFRRALTVLTGMTSKVFYAGERVGDGQAVKLVNNMINSCYRISTLEIVALGRKLGFTLGQLAEAINAGNGINYFSKHYLTAVVEGRPTTDFALSLMVKDLNLAIEQGMSCGSSMPISCLARSMVLAGFNAMGPNSRLDDILPFMETMSAVRYRAIDDDVAGDQALPSPALLEMLSTAISACNRLIVSENMAAGSKAGMGIAEMGAIINNGSGWSLEGARVIENLSLKAPAAPSSLVLMVENLRRVERLAAERGAPLVVTGAVRASYEACAEELGEGAALDAMASRFTEANHPS